MSEKRILLVDDDPDILKVFGEMLRLEGYAIREASSGREALRLTRELRPGLVLLDVVLPDLNGMEVCWQIKNDPELQDVFVALISGEATRGSHKLLGAESGADDYILKPVGREELLARVRTLFRLREAVVAVRASEQQCRLAETKYRSMVENAAEGIFQTTPEGRFLSANPALARILGYDSPEDLLAGVSDISTQLYVQPRRRRELLLLLRTKGSVQGFEAELYRQDGSRIWLRENVHVVSDASGKVLYFEGMVQDITENKLFEEELHSLPRRIIEVQEAERLRVSRELHDGVNQLIASAQMRLRRVRDSLTGKPAAREILARCQDLLALALEENRRIAHDLRPSELDQLGLAAACRELCKRLALRTKLSVCCQVQDLPERLAPELELHLFRIVQEALNNVERHAGAEALSLRITTRGGVVSLRIHDNGRGFEPRSSPSRKLGSRGVGLTHMTERAAFLGGRCNITSAPHRGTTVHVTVPLKFTPLPTPGTARIKARPFPLPPSKQHIE